MPYQYESTSSEAPRRPVRRDGRSRRRRRRSSRLLPILVLAVLAVGLWLLLSRGSGEEVPETTQYVDPGTSSATLCFVGDISLDEPMMEAFRTGGGYDFTPLFRRIVPLLATADLTVGNLEGNITDNSGVGDHCYPTALLNALYSAGFDVLQTSNSYSIHNGITGLAATKHSIQAAGMEALGTWTSEADRRENGVLIREVNGIRVAFLAFTKGLTNLRLPAGSGYCVNLLYTDYDTNYSKVARSAIQSAVEEARLQGPDLIVAMVHWGSEYDKQVTDSQKEIAELFFDSGVNLVIGSHSHYVGPMEVVSRQVQDLGGSFIAYSLGDFVSIADSATARNGCVLSITVVKDGYGVRLSEVSYTPTYSAAPSEALEIQDYEILDIQDALSFYQQGYYDRISDPLYNRLTTALDKLRDQTGQPDLLAVK